jgi:hypothetical protein
MVEYCSSQCDTRLIDELQKNKLFLSSLYTLVPSTPSICTDYIYIQVPPTLNRRGLQPYPR